MTKTQFKDYVIIGDSKDFKDCLIRVCGPDKEYAEKILKEVLANPNDTKMYTNIRLNIVYDGWWHYGTD